LPYNKPETKNSAHGFTSLPTQKAEYSLSGFFLTNKQTSKQLAARPGRLLVKTVLRASLPVMPLGPTAGRV